MRKLRTEEELGGGKPSQFLRGLQQLQGESSIEPSFLRDLLVQSLPLILLSIRSSTKTDSNCSAAELVYGTSLRLPSEFFPTPSGLTSSTGNSDDVARLATLVLSQEVVPIACPDHYITGVLRSICLPTCTPQPKCFFAKTVAGVL